MPVKVTDSAVTPRSPSAAEADPLAPNSKKDGEEDMAWLVGAENVGVPEDRRGKGETQITGRKVRKYVGSKRPPGIDPQVWFKVLKARDRERLIKQYEDYVAKLQAGCTCKGRASRFSCTRNGGQGRWS